MPACLSRPSAGRRPGTVAASAPPPPPGRPRPPRTCRARACTPGRWYDAPPGRATTPPVATAGAVVTAVDAALGSGRRLRELEGEQPVQVVHLRLELTDPVDLPAKVLGGQEGSREHDEGDAGQATRDEERQLLRRQRLSRHAVPAGEQRGHPQQREHPPEDGPHRRPHPLPEHAPVRKRSGCRLVGTATVAGFGRRVAGPDRVAHRRLLPGPVSRRWLNTIEPRQPTNKPTVPSASTA